MLQALSSAVECQELYLRRGDYGFMARLNKKLQLSRTQVQNFRTFKVASLLRAHLSRVRLIGYLCTEQREVLKTSTHMLLAFVDLLGSLGLIEPVVVGIELSQMLVQGMWSRYTQFLQLP
jgi:hypothetical protein